MPARASTSKPSAKPRWERKAEERPTALYQAALDVFAQRGYRAARLEEVAEAAGVSKGTIYHYFKNKEDLLARALEDKHAALRAKTQAALGDFSGSAEAKLRVVLAWAWERWMTEEWGRYNQLIFGEIIHELPGIFRLWAKEGLMQIWDFLEKIIRKGQAIGEFRGDVDARAVSRFIYSGLSHQALLQIHMGIGKIDKCSPQQIFDGALDLVLRGLRTTREGAKSAGSKRAVTKEGRKS